MTNFREIRTLFDVWDNSFGISEVEIIECEKHLGSKLPDVLRDYYLQLGNNDRINQTQDSLIRPVGLKVEDSGFVIFYHENQWVWQAGIKFSDFKLANPAVYLTYDEKMGS